MRLGSAATVTYAVLSEEMTLKVGRNVLSTSTYCALWSSWRANTLPPTFCDATGKDPAGLNAYDGGIGNEGGGELGGGEEEGDAEDPVFH